MFLRETEHIAQSQRHKWPVITTIYTSSRKNCLWYSSLTCHALFILPHFPWQKFTRDKIYNLDNNEFILISTHNRCKHTQLA